MLQKNEYLEFIDTYGEDKCVCCLEDMESNGEWEGIAYRWSGTAYEICELKKAKGPEDHMCLSCSKNCKDRKKYYIKCLHVSKVRDLCVKINKENQESVYTRSSVFAHFQCMRQEMIVLDKLKYTSAYLVPPKYRFNKELAGVIYPYWGKSLSHFLQEALSGLDEKKQLMLKEKLIQQILYGIKSYAVLPEKLVHRDLKPENIRIQDLEDGDILVSIIDFDWMHMGSQENDPFARISGGTSGFAHPKSFAKNEEGELTEYPSIRWDLYSAALLCYNILEGRKHFSNEEIEYTANAKNSQGYWNDDTIGFVLRNLTKTRDILCRLETEEDGIGYYNELYRILQKMMGEDRHYKNQYQDIDEVIEDYEKYLKNRYKKNYLKYFKVNYYLKNDDIRYFCDDVIQIRCRKIVDAQTTVEQYILLAEYDAATLLLDEEKTVVFYCVGDKQLRATLLADQWRWSDCEEKHYFIDGYATAENQEQNAILQIDCQIM